jgi:hypothetical protein
MVVKVRLPSGAELHEPPYTKEEIADFYKRVGGGPIAVSRSGTRAKSTEQPQPSPAKSDESSAD